MGGWFWTPASDFKPCFVCFPSVLGLQDPLEIMTKLWGEYGAACSRSQREGLQIGGILLFCFFLLWKLFKRRDLFEWFTKSILRSALIKLGPGSCMTSVLLHSCQSWVRCPPSPSVVSPGLMNSSCSHSDQLGIYAVWVSAKEKNCVTLWL